MLLKTTDKKCWPFDEKHWPFDSIKKAILQVEKHIFTKINDKINKSFILLPC